MIARLVVAFVVLSVVFLALERLRPVHRGRKLFRPGYRTDVVHFFVTGTLTTVAVFAVALPFYVAGVILRPAGLQDAIRSQPWIVQLAEAMLLSQLAFYFVHRLAHRVGWMWRFHRVHHSSPQLDWLAAPHLHPIDQGLGLGLSFAPLLLLGGDLAVFGAIAGLLQAHAIFQHANFRIGFGPFRSVVSAPSFHHWHHSNDVEARDCNFAGLFPWIDRWFGTYHDPAGAWPRTYGIDTPMPKGYLRQLASPFVPAYGAAPAGVNCGDALQRAS